MHELLDAIFKNVEEKVRSDLETPFFESLSQSQELLEVLREFVIIVDAIKAEFDI
jgi:DNA anti-recombination protein RmuC